MYTINILRNYFYFPIFFQKNLRLGSRGFILLIFIFYSYYEIIIDIKLKSSSYSPAHLPGLLAHPHR
jgi:hypothetical protein